MPTPNTYTKKFTPDGKPNFRPSVIALCVFLFIILSIHLIATNIQLALVKEQLNAVSASYHIQSEYTHELDRTLNSLIDIHYKED